MDSQGENEGTLTNRQRTLKRGGRVQGKGEKGNRTAKGYFKAKGKREKGTLKTGGRGARQKEQGKGTAKGGGFKAKGQKGFKGKWQVVKANPPKANLKKLEEKRPPRRRSRARPRGPRSVSMEARCASEGLAIARGCCAMATNRQYQA